MKILFNNVMQGISHYEEGESQGNPVDHYNPDAFVEIFSRFAPDVICLVEVPFDTKEKTSDFLDIISARLRLPYRFSHTTETSWLLPGKWYGMSILSRWPLQNQAILPLTNPRLQTTWWNGQTFSMHDKHVQSCIVNCPDKTFHLKNFHGFPFHKFKENLKSYPHVCEEIARILTPQAPMPMIVTGDFNNKDTALASMYPNLFDTNGLRNTVLFDMQTFFINESMGQIDHILCSHQFQVTQSIVDRGVSDHPVLVADLTYASDS